jgi:hypothetical protein
MALNQIFQLPISANDETILLFSEDKYLDITSDSNNLVYIDFLLDKEFIEERKDIFEVKFYLQRSKNLKIFVNENFANTFQLNEQVQVHFFNKKIQIEFSLIDGGGDFWGHIFFSDQPTNDWMIGLRTIRRDLSCRIRAKISIY